ncbi:flagellar hook-associated protein FlgK [Sphingoaurantiacus capsulatus]|uniref:Flagellar hook-associated protein 1 n=1 Tax=Sphingoaurantiacus capsulatus TaxID=1771310 RepID=A0ABV7XEA0_9SPHN
MSDLLSIGLSGVSAYRTALAAVGDNVANAEVEGYSRRSVRLTEAGIIGDEAIGQPAGLRFTGVKATSVDRAWDDFQAAESRLSASADGRASTRAYWLGQVESKLGFGELSVGSRVGAFFNSATALAANPKDTLGRAAMLSSLNDAATTIRTTAEGLKSAAAGIQASATREVDVLNGDLEALSRMNVALLQGRPGSSSYASAQDERDRIIDRIAQQVDVKVELGSDGTATLKLAGASNVTLLDPAGRGLVVVNAAADGRLSLSIARGDNLDPLPVSGGKLAGLVDVSSSTAAKRGELDALATKLVADINTWSAAGRDLAGNPGGPMLAITAGAISLQVVMTDPSAVAAASSTSDNGNLLDINSLRGTDGVEAKWAALVAGSSQATASAKSESAAAATKRDQAFAARDETSGIDLDREAAELLRFQQAYGASTRIIQVARETLQSILDLF